MIDDGSILFIDNSNKNQDNQEPNIDKTSTNKINSLYTSPFTCPLNFPIDSGKKRFSCNSAMNEEKYWKKSCKILEMHPRKSTPLLRKERMKSLFYKNKNNAKSNTSIWDFANIIIY